MKIRKKKKGFFIDEHAMLGLPMRLTVSLVIGTIVLVSILSVLLNPCFFPQPMVVTVTPMITVLSGDDLENISFIVFVNDTKAHPLMGASVIIKGLGGAGSGFSNKDGKAVIQLQVSLEQGLYEGYLDISVKATCHNPYEQQGIVKVVKRSN